MPYLSDQQQANTGSFIPTSTIFDVTQIAEINVNSKEFKELLVRLYNTVISMAFVLNNKATGYYVLDEFVTGKNYFASDNSQNPRPIYGIVVQMGAITAGATVTVAHNLTITSTWQILNMEAVANDTVNLIYYPLNWASTSTTKDIQLTMNGTNVVIINNTAVNFTKCDVYIEYIKY